MSTARRKRSRRRPGGTSGSIHGLGYLFSALRREGLIADELVLQLATFLRSLDLFLELTVRTVPRTLTANKVRRGGKQGTDGPELSRIHSSTQHPRDKRREASAHGADQQRLQHSRAGQRTALCSFWCFAAHRAASNYEANAILALLFRSRTLVVGIEDSLTFALEHGRLRRCDSRRVAANLRRVRGRPGDPR